MQPNSCPICQRQLAHAVVGSTKFERRLPVLRCETCDFDVPCPGGGEAPEDALLGLAERCFDATASRITAAVDRLREISVPTECECPYCQESLRYRVAREHLECRECGYQEHMPRGQARRLRAI